MLTVAHLEHIGSHVLDTQALGISKRRVCLLCCFLRRPKVDMRIHSTGYHLLRAPLKGHKRISKCPSLPSSLGQWQICLAIYAVYAEETETKKEVNSMKH